MTKSTSGVTTAPSGSRTRGKYTFVISALFPAMLPLALLNAGWKYRPHEHAGEDEDRVRNVIGRELREAAEDEREDARRQQRLEHDPGDPMKVCL